MNYRIEDRIFGWAYHLSGGIRYSIAVNMSQISLDADTLFAENIVTQIPTTGFDILIDDMDDGLQIIVPDINTTIYL